MAARFDPWHFCSYLTLLFFVIGIYDVVAHWPFPFRVITISNLFPEYPLIALVLLISYSRERTWRQPMYYAGLTTVLVAYASFDIFRYYFKTAPRPSDLQNTALIWDFAPAVALATLMVWFATAALYLGSLVQERRRARATWGRVLALVLAVGLITSPVFEGVVAATYKDIDWSEDLTVSLNGRFATFAKLGIEEREAAKALAQHAPWDLAVMDKVFPGVPTRKPNIYVIVLESFLDPRLVRGATFNRSPLADEMRPFLIGGDHFSQVLSPAYGGKSVNAEFELLTGLRALCRISSVDFNVMRGGKTDGFVKRLKEHGYAVNATKASNSSYFNVRRAYDSLGFEGPVFLGDRPKSAGEEPVLFDGDFFEHNLKAVLEKNAAGRGPTLHYMVGMYGHFPYTDDPAKRPAVIKARHPDEVVRRIANQFYYRTKALGWFLRELKTADPGAIFFVVSDHLPPVFDKKTDYVPRNKFVNIALLMDGDQIVDVSGRRYHEITQLLWDRLSGRGNRVPLDERAMEDAYMQLLSASRMQVSR